MMPNIYRLFICYHLSSKNYQISFIIHQLSLSSILYFWGPPDIQTHASCRGVFDPKNCIPQTCRGTIYLFELLLYDMPYQLVCIYILTVVYPFSRLVARNNCYILIIKLFSSALCFRISMGSFDFSRHVW